MGKPSRKSVKLIIAAARAQGWDVTFTGSGHYQLRPPSGPLIVIAATPRGSGERLDAARCRRAGLRI